MNRRRQLITALDPHPNVIGWVTILDSMTVSFDGRTYHRTGKEGHSLIDSTPVAEYRDVRDHRA